MTPIYRVSVIDGMIFGWNREGVNDATCTPCAMGMEATDVAGL